MRLLQGCQRLLRTLAASRACRSEEDDRVLDVLRAEAAERLEILGENPDRPRLLALEEFRHEIGQRLRVHDVEHSISYEVQRHRALPSEPDLRLDVAKPQAPARE
jgi:hypothetical protein